jgi:hypothetical protein
MEFSSIIPHSLACTKASIREAVSPSAGFVPGLLRDIMDARNRRPLDGSEKDYEKTG